MFVFYLSVYCTSSTWKQLRKCSWVSPLALALCTIQLFKRPFFKYGKMYISAHPPPAHPYTCIVRCGCASHPSHPAGDALSPEHISLSAPSPATCAHRCTHPGLTLCSPSSCSAKAIYFSCCGRKGELLCTWLLSPASDV